MAGRPALAAFPEQGLIYFANSVLFIILGLQGRGRPRQGGVHPRRGRADRRGRGPPARRVRVRHLQGTDSTAGRVDRFKTRLAKAQDFKQKAKKPKAAKKKEK